jgi:hypothetical protein
VTIEDYQSLGCGINAGMNSIDPDGTEEETSGDDADPLSDRQNDYVNRLFPQFSN